MTDSLPMAEINMTVQFEKAESEASYEYGAAETSSPVNPAEELMTTSQTSESASKVQTEHTNPGTEHTENPVQRQSEAQVSPSGEASTMIQSQEASVHDTSSVSVVESNAKEQAQSSQDSELTAPPKESPAGSAGASGDQQLSPESQQSVSKPAANPGEEKLPKSNPGEPNVNPAGETAQQEMKASNPASNPSDILPPSQEASQQKLPEQPSNSDQTVPSNPVPPTPSTLEASQQKPPEQPSNPQEQVAPAASDVAEGNPHVQNQSAPPAVKKPPPTESEEEEEESDEDFDPRKSAQGFKLILGGDKPAEPSAGLQQTASDVSKKTEQHVSEVSQAEEVTAPPVQTEQKTTSDIVTSAGGTAESGVAVQP